MRKPCTWVRSGLPVLAGLVALMLGPATARAESAGRAATLQHAISSIVGGAGDVVLTPVVTARTLWGQGKAAGYEAPAMASLGLFGTAWLAPLNLSAGLFRTWGGLIELPIGLGVLATKSFTDWQPPPLFDVERNPALVDYANPVVPLKFGVSYLESKSSG